VKIHLSRRLENRDRAEDGDTDPRFFSVLLVIVNFTISRVEQGRRRAPAIQELHVKLEGLAEIGL